MSRGDPVEFTRRSDDDRLQRCGNRVQLEDTEGTAVGNDVNLAEYAGTATGAANPIDVVDVWDVIVVEDDDANDSDKTYTFPANYMYQVLAIYVELTTTASAGDRQLEVQLLDYSDNIIQDYRPHVTQAASLTYKYVFGPGLAQDTDVYDTDHITTPIVPTMIVSGTYDLRIYDNNAVAAAADDMTIRLHLARRIY